MMVSKNEEGAAVEAVEEVMEVDSEKPSVISLNVLPMIKKRQQQHGLRYSHFQRYHGYCSRRLKRLRTTLKLPQGNVRHFKKKDVTLNDIESAKGDSRHLEIPLTLAERAWSSAMALKQDANTETRKKFHYIGRLKKATGYSDTLLQLALDSSRVDQRTRQECEAYKAFIHGSFYFELKMWSEAMEAYKKAQTIYTQIGQEVGDHDGSVYTEKNSEIATSIKFCAYQMNTDKVSELAVDLKSTVIEPQVEFTKSKTEPEKPIIDKNQPKLVPLPDFRSIPGKPIFFDLSLNNITMPKDDIEEKAGMSLKKSPSKEGSGISGLVKGLWGWGGKK